MQIQPDQSYIEQHLRSIIIHSLDHFNYSNAEFACERLLADDPENLDSIYLYCLTLFKRERYKSCYNKSSNLSDHLGCSFMYAKLCLKLKKHKEGIFQLLKISYLYNETSSFYQDDKFNPAYFTTPQSRYNYENSRSILPDLSTIYRLLGDLYKGMGDTKNSALNYGEALKYNQFDYEAFQELCKLGVNVKVKAIYKSNLVFNSDYQSQIKEKDSLKILNDMSGNNITNPFSATTLANETNTNNTIANPNNINGNKSNSNLQADDSFSNPISTPRVTVPSVPDAPLRKAGNNEPLTNRFEFTKPSFPIDTTSSLSIDPNARQTKRESTYSKITSRLISQPNNNKPTDNNAPANINTNNLNKRTAVRGSLKRNSPNSFSANTHTNNENHQAPLSIMANKEIELGDNYLLGLYMVFSKGFKSMCKYDCYKAIRILESLPQKEKESPWVLSKLGRLHYEIVNYKQSEYFFVKLRKLDRTRLEDMEYYSTLLWHLHKKVELTYLANELHDLDPHSPITWCTIGNLFSLTREPDEAIKCFNKSIKFDESFIYAYTLKGHEYFGNDNYEMALENFRISLLIDSRHYNALYGIGMVYINLGDYQKADYHFRKAVSINPINVILICCVGMVLEKVGKNNLALRQYELANKLQPLNPLPIFKKAQLLFSMQQFQQALHYFKVLKDLAPDEASVHFLLGQLYNIQNDKFQAIKEFTIALNLDPKGNYLIREAMESLKDK